MGIIYVQKFQKFETFAKKCKILRLRGVVITLVARLFVRCFSKSIESLACNKLLKQHFLKASCQVQGVLGNMSEVQCIGLLYNNTNNHFWTLGLSEGVLSNRPCPSVCPSVRVSVFKYLRDCSLIFSSFLHEVRAS